MQNTIMSFNLQLYNFCFYFLFYVSQSFVNLTNMSQSKFKLLFHISYFLCECKYRCNVNCKLL